MADLPGLDDSRLSLLVAVYAEAARNLQLALDGLLIETSGPRRFLLFQKVLRTLRELEATTDTWSAQFVRQFYEEADKEALAILERSGVVAQFGATIGQDAVALLVGKINGTLSKATAGIEQLAGRIFRSPALEVEFPALARQVERQVAVGLAEGALTATVRGRIAGKLRSQFRDGLVSVIGKGGRRFTFPMDFYAGMVSQNLKASARSVATLTRAREANSDLVRVTPNPSKGGDWCNVYRGRVFSISGAHPLYPPLAATPNGGPPFHPWCKHGLGVFIPEFHTSDQRQEFAQVNEEFLMRPSEDNPNRVIRNYWQALRDDRPPPALRNH